MNELTAAIRALHFISIIELFGGFAFLMVVGRPAFRGNADAGRQEQRELDRWAHFIAGWSLIVVVASGASWLVVEAAAMSGLPLYNALSGQILGTVLGETTFGRVSEIRLGLAAALSATLFSNKGWSDDRGRLILGTCGLLLSGALLATLAWIGHAASEQGAERYMHLTADALHLIAAGAWLGALPPLVFLLTRARHAAGSETFEFAVSATRRFSILGVVSVGTLLVTGIVNSWYTVASVPALVGTPYGRTLLLKLLLFGVMVTLAAINRLRLTPKIVSASGGARGKATPLALRWLWCNAITETGLGLIIVVIVGVLGVQVPAAHTQPVWPFSYTLNWEAAVSPVRHTALLAVAAGIVVALAFILRSAVTRRRRAAIVGVIAFGSAIAIFVSLLTAPAYPTTYFRSPVRYTAASIARGAPLYAKYCIVCHGREGYGDGPAAASLRVKPANLTEEHLFHHGDGNLFWWLQHGIAGTLMPGFANQIDESQIWDVINYLRAQAEAEAAKTIGDRVEPWRPIVAPDFTFQIDRRPQETLKQQRSRFIVLLVFYTLPKSLARLRALTEDMQALERAGVRIVAVPMDRSTVAHEANMLGVDASIIANSNPDLVAGYSLFRRTVSIDRWPPTPTHMEFLIDRAGYFRARGLFSVAQDRFQIPKLLEQIEVLNHEKLRRLAPEGHVH